MPDDHTAQNPPEQLQSAQPQSAPLISDPELQQLLELVAKEMGLPPERALRRCLETVLAMYGSAAQGGLPIIRYAGTRTEQVINLPRPIG
jgi:hypothetical protein